MENYFEEIKKNALEHNTKFWGVVEDNVDPMNLGRVKVRCFHYHTEDTNEIPTDALPWALVLTPTTSASISGVGESPNGLERGSWVYGFFMDGRDAQYPVVTHSVPGIHRPEAPGQPSGTSTGFLNKGDYHGGETTEDNQAAAPYNNSSGQSTLGGNPSPDSTVPYTNQSAQGQGAMTAVGDINQYLQPKDAPRWKELGFKYYTWRAAPDGFACKDGLASLRMHYNTALALEKLTEDVGKGKFALTSAYRTPAYNMKVAHTGPHGPHTTGRAIDIPFSSIGGGSKANLAAFGKMAVKRGFVGFGIYWSQNFIHIDTLRGRTWLGASEPWFRSAITEAGWYHGKPGLSGVSTSQGSKDENADPNDSKGIQTRTANQEAVYNHLKAQGYNDTQIAGIMGNLQTESGFNPNARTIDSNGKVSYGIAQWNGDRYTALQNYTGTATPSLSQQLDFMDHELQTTHKSAVSALSSAGSVSEATLGFGSAYEVYSGHGDPNSASSRSRLANANAFATGNAVPDGNPRGYQDPTNSLPTPEYRGEPSTHMNARGFNSYSNQTRLLAKDSGRMTGMPAAGDIGTFGEPELKAAPQYPYNHTKSTRAGHIIELDDTPGAERVNIEAGSGTGLEMFGDGSAAFRIHGNYYQSNYGDSYQGVMGKYFLTSVNDMHIRSTSDMNLQSDGAMVVNMGGDGSLLISGDYLVSVGDELKFRANKIVFESMGDIDILAHKNVNIEGRSGVTIKGAKNVDIEAGSQVGLKSPLVTADDIMRVGEGKSKSVEGAESSDLGAPPKRKVVNKDNLKNSANKTGGTTTQEAFEHYSGGTV
jgi:hypothetical protein